MKPPLPLSDELVTRWSLIQRLKNRSDQESWGEFFETYWRLIYGVAVKSGLTDAEAQDVVQETVISVSDHMEQFEANPEAGSFKSWLLQMTRWRMTDQIRRRRSIEEKQPDDDDNTPVVEQLPDPAGLELERIWDEEWQSNLIKSALERVQHQVSASHYQAFYLYAVRQLSVDQVAKVVGIAANDVYLIKHRLMPLFDKAVRSIEFNER